MTKNVIRVFALALGLTAVVAIAPLSAQTTLPSQIVNIPFAFHVQNVSMPAGEYRLESMFGKGFVVLESVQTGRKIQVMRHEAASVPGKAPHLIFELGPQGYTLKGLV